MDNKTTYSVPALLSFVVPGLGQLVKKEFLKAVIIWVAAFLLFIDVIAVQLGLVIMGHTLPLFPFLIVVFVFWLWNVYDAYNSHAGAKIG